MQRTPRLWAALLFMSLLGRPAAVIAGDVTYSEIVKVTASDATSGDAFGTSIDVSGAVMVVGANIADGVTSGTGAAYLFVRNQTGADAWGEAIKLVAPDGEYADNFGRDVAVDGDTVAIGAFGDGPGSVYVFERNQGGADAWGLVTKIVPSDGAEDDWFGDSVAIWGDTIVVGSSGDDDAFSRSGSAYVYRRDQGGPDAWGEVVKLGAQNPVSNGYFGRAVGVSGDTIVVGLANSIEIFERNLGGADAWGRVKVITEVLPLYGSFGFSVDVDGSHVAVGGPAMSGPGQVFVYRRNLGGADNWGEAARLSASDGTVEDWFGGYVSISGDRILVGAERADAAAANAGAVYLYERNKGGADTWGEVQQSVASDADVDDEFGQKAAIDGTTIAVGAWSNDDHGSYSGSAYVFAACGAGTPDLGDGLDLVASDAASSDFFGNALGISGDTAIVGADGNDDLGAYSGSAYILHRNTGGADAWGEVRILTASDGGADHRFGISASISGDTAVVGASGHPSAGTQTGAAYVFRRNLGGADAWGEVVRLTASDAAASDRFGERVAVAGDTIIVGAPYNADAGSATGAAYVFQQNHGGADAWGEVVKLLAADASGIAFFGQAVAVAGDVAVVGAPQAESGGVLAGAAYVFVRNAGGADAWGQVAKLAASDGVAGDFFGRSVSISGDIVVVGADQSNGSSPAYGAVYVFARNAGGPDAWGQVAKLSASDPADADVFGYAVATDGNLIVVGAPQRDEYRGAVYAFARNAGGADAWGEIAELDAAVSGSMFGRTVAAGHGVVIVGTPFASAPASSSGMVSLYRTGCIEYDFGDASDPWFPTVLVSNGARHRLGVLFMGAAIDADPDGQPTAAADGDDTDANGDDEDGVVFTTLTVPGSTADVEVVASGVCLLNAWVDFTADGDWSDPGEQVFTDEPLVGGANSLTFPVPVFAEQDATAVARFRVDSAGGLGITGEAADGEVEDHTLVIEAIDLGDAPDPTFPTLQASDGPRHVLGGPLFLGATVDPDPDGQPTTSADGDDTDGLDDDDGVVFSSVLMTGYDATLEVTASAPGLLNAWFDFTADGDWSDPGEQVFSDHPMNAGVNQLAFQVPADATLGDTYVRFRIDSMGGLAPTGLALDGEVEDELVQVRFSALDVPETGQTTSWAAGDDGTFQVGVPWPDPRFTDHGDGTITDELTGLMWSQDNVSPGPPACGPGVRKSWYDSLAHVDCLNANSWLGHSDWRMPNVIEILSLANHSEPDQRTWLAGQGFSLTPWYYWWASTTPVGSLATAFVLGSDGSNGFVSKTNTTGATVWPVRGSSEGSPASLAKTGQTRCWNSSYSEVPCPGTGQDGEHQAGVEWPSPRFDVSGDCVTDRLTGLTWTRDGNLFGGRSWDQAVDDAADLTLCGYDDWRLPTRFEAQSLMHFDRRTGTTPPTMTEWWESQGFVNTSPYQMWAGTSEPAIPEISAYTMIGRSNKTSTTWVVWPVRGNLLSAPADLAVSIGGSADPVVPGENLIVTVGVSNLGPNPADEVRAAVTLPGGATFVAASGTGWSCAEATGVVTCTVATLAVGAAPVIDVELTTPFAPGDTVVTSVLVDSLGDDPVGDNNSAVEGTTLEEVDFGDAPDPAYPTVLDADGARHVLGGGLFLGAAVDGETDGQPTAGADGDDLNGTDDEDGVAFTTLVARGAMASVEVQSSAPGVLNAWVDFNADGDWTDPGEQIVTDVGLTTGVNLLSFAVPVDAVLGATVARFRLDSAGGLAPTGLADDGEVEDHLATIVTLDFGDAADPSYPTLLASDGARHLLGGGLFLGAAVDGEADGLPTAGADGDDLDGADDEDGVAFTSVLQVGFDATIDVTASAAGLLNAWVDLNADGDWNDPEEQVFTDTAVTAGVTNLVIPIPLDATGGASVARFRLDSAGGLAPTGLAADGEVEDYAVVIEPSAEVEVTVSDSPDPAVEGGGLTYFVDIVNHGGLDATGVVLTDTLPPEAVFVGVAPGAPTCSEAAGVVTCDLGTLAGGAATQVVIAVDLPYGTIGTLSSTAVVALDQSDPVPSSNTDVESTVVVADADHIFTDGFESGATDRWSVTGP